jgi:hypothetical protein
MMESLIKNIINTRLKATPEDVKAGVEWYAVAQQNCLDIAESHCMPLNIVVGVVAALSPNNKWTRNIANANDLIGAFMYGDTMESVKVSTYNTMKQKAWDILEAMPSDNAAIIRMLNGQKIIAFFECIMDLDSCCIDGHARNIAYNERIGLTDDRTNIGKREYRELVQAYVAASKRCTIVDNGKRRKLKPYELQAITWTVWRKQWGIV